MILVTGANSLLGTNVVIELLNRGYRVRCLVRRTNEVIDKTEVVLGNVNDSGQVGRAMQGCRAVIHIAAITDQDLLRLDDYRFNWECARLVARCAKEAHLDRMVFVSSANTVGNGVLECPAQESRLLAKPYSGSLYAQSKVRAEREVVESFPGTIIINSGFMIGPHDSKPSSGEIITRALGRKVVAIPGGGKSFVHVADVATTVVNALSRGSVGQRYLATGVSMSVRDFYIMMQGVTGYKFRMIRVPDFLLIGAGYIGDFMRCVGIKTPLSSVNTKILCQKEFYDNSKAVCELDMPQSSIEGAIQQAIEWFEGHSANRG